MPGLISASVGRGGKNKPDDVEAVQAALNKYARAGLEEDGKCGPKTIKAIENFQKSLKFSKPDGLVEPGKQTEQGLRGQKVEAPSGAGAGGPGGGKSGGEAAAVNAGSVFGVTLGSIAAAGVAGAVKAAKLAEASRDETEKFAQQIINKLKQASAQVGGDEGKAIQKELEDAYKESMEHVRKIEAAAKDLAKRQTADAVKTLQKRAEESVPGFKSMEDLVEQGNKWLQEKGPGYAQDAKDLAKQITKEMADRKQEVDKWYKEATSKLSKTDDSEWDDEGKKIKEELEKAYKQSTQQIKKVVEETRKTVDKVTDTTIDALKKTAELTSPAFNAVENLAKKALDWWESD